MAGWTYLVMNIVLPVQGVLDRFDDIVLAAGTCGTACALGIANYLTGSKLKYVHLLCCIPFVYLLRHVIHVVFCRRF